jgi:hypothetical protein
MLTAPIDHPLNLTTQLIMNSASYFLWAILLFVAIRMGIKHKTPFFVLIILAAAFGALFEPLYDVGFMLWFYSPGMVTSFTSYGIPQPIWAYSGYVVLYAGPAMFICDRIARGLTPKGLLQWAGVVFLCSCVFEMVGIDGGAYEYWGPHVFRILNYPLAIGVLETAQVICFSVAAAALRRASSGWAPLLALFILFPCMFYFANFGAGAPLIIAIHTQDPSAMLVMAATSLSIVFGLTLIWAAARLLPSASAFRAAALRA